MGRARELAEVATAYVGGGLNFRNRIINGDMRIDQRNNGAAVTGQQYLVDRWRCWFDPGTYSFQQVTDAPTGFSNSLRVTKTNTTQSTYAGLVQYIEGFNTADLAFGTANASTVTLSFWVKSSVTGTFTVTLGNAAENRWYGAAYTINSANTWEQKSVTIPGDTTGTWVGSTNGIGIQIWFNYGAAATAQAAGVWTSSANARAVTGSTSLGTTNGATFYITGVQLEAGSVATPFERRPYGAELALCQRYYQVLKAAVAVGRSSTGVGGSIAFQQQMRASPTLNKTSGLIKFGDYILVGASSSSTPTLSTSDILDRDKGVLFDLSGFTGFTTRHMYFHEVEVTASGLFTLSAEL